MNKNLHLPSSVFVPPPQKDLIEKIECCNPVKVLKQTLKHVQYNLNKWSVFLQILSCCSQLPSWPFTSINRRLCAATETGLNL